MALTIHEVHLVRPKITALVADSGRVRVSFYGANGQDYTLILVGDEGTEDTVEHVGSGEVDLTPSSNGTKTVQVSADGVDPAQVVTQEITIPAIPSDYR